MDFLKCSSGNESKVLFTIHRAIASASVRYKCEVSGFCEVHVEVIGALGVSKRISGPILDQQNPREAFNSS